MSIGNFRILQSYETGKQIPVDELFDKDSLKSAPIDTSSGTQSLVNALDQRIIHVNSIAALGALDSTMLVDGQQARVESAGSFRWSSSKSEWLPDELSARTASYASLQEAVTASNGRRLELEPETYEVSETITFPSNNFEVSGQLRKTKLQWTGPATGGLSMFKIDSAGDGSVASINSHLSKLSFDGGNAEFSDGVISATYLSRNSLLSDIDVGFISGGVAVRINKEWYLELERVRCQQATRAGTAFYYDTSVNQVNDVLASKIGANQFDKGLVLDTSGSSINSPTFVLPSIENCNTGIEFIPGSGVRQMNVYGGYFEGNMTDIYWPTSSSKAQASATVNWNGIYFNNGAVHLEEGNHNFIGCQGISSVTVGPGATVYIEGNASLSVTHLEGSGKNNYLHLPLGPIQTPHRLRYAGPRSRPVTGETETITSSSSISHAFSIPDTLLSTLPSWGGSISIEVLARRNYETSSTQYMYGILSKSSTGSWGLMLIHNSTTATFSHTLNSSNGAITIEYTASDFKVVDFRWLPY